MDIERFPIESAHVLMFARSLGCTDDVYSENAFVATGLSGVAAPPTFVQASAQFESDYPLRPHPTRRWFGSGGGVADNDVSSPPGDQDVYSTQSADDRNVLHAEQRFEFVRPVRVGATLTSRQRDGRTWEKSGRKGGRLIFSELITEFFDADGELVVTTTAVAVLPQALPGERGESK